MQKRELDQALTAKEFAVLAGISYSKARTWFRSPEFPVFDGVVFWSDFADYRRQKNTYVVPALSTGDTTSMQSMDRLPDKAARILLEA